jgi:putative SOS response-associated peptidase YedK
MCGRSTLTVKEEALEKKFGSTFYSEDLERYNPLPSFNIAPTHFHPVIPFEDRNHFKYMRWGLVPFWSKDDKGGAKMINARIETVAEKPAFKNALMSKRCLVPLDGYYEWLKVGKSKIPYRIIVNQGDLFMVAGLYETWKMPSGDSLFSFTLLTTTAYPAISHIHDRMPCILDPERYMSWLDPSLSGPDAIKTIPIVPTETIEFYRVSDAVNKVSHNDPSLIAPISSPSVNGTNGIQLSLFNDPTN